MYAFAVPMTVGVTARDMTPAQQSSSLPVTPVRSTGLVCSAESSRHSSRIPLRQIAARAASGALLSAALLLGPVQTDAANNSVKLPPIDRSDARRCEPASSAIGQANAARDKLLDLRECDLRGRDLTEYDISGALLSDANLSDAKLVGAQLSKSYAPSASFKGADFTNAIVDRVTFDKADLSGAIFANAVLSDSTFDNANLEGVDFTDVYVGDFVQRNICRNPTTKGTNPVTGTPTRESLGCR